MLIAQYRSHEAIRWSFYQVCPGCLTVLTADCPCMPQAHSQRSKSRTCLSCRSSVVNIERKSYLATASSPCICSRIFTRSDPPTKPTVTLGITWHRFSFYMLLLNCTSYSQTWQNKISLFYWKKCQPPLPWNSSSLLWSAAWSRLKYWQHRMWDRWHLGLVIVPSTSKRQSKRFLLDPAILLPDDHSEENKF